MTIPQSVLRLCHVAICLLASCTSSIGQHASSLKVHVVDAFNGMLTITYERAFTQHVSIQLSLQGGNYSKFRPNRDETFETKGTGAIAAMRYFPFTEKITAPRGLFGYGAVRAMRYTERYSYLPANAHYEIDGQMYNAGLGIGYKLAYRRLGMEALVGWGIGRRVSENEAYRQSVRAFSFNGMEEQQHFPQLDFALCYLFGRVREKKS